jgi:hypothetical protein
VREELVYYLSGIFAELEEGKVILSSSIPLSFYNIEALGIS